MKIKKSTIVWFALAVLFLGCFFFVKDYDKGEHSPNWWDATYVEDAKVLPENEGKLVGISGYPEMVEPVEDTIMGVSFQSPKVTRMVEQLDWNGEEWVWKSIEPGKSENGMEEATLAGRIKVGEFELDEDLIKTLSVMTRDVMKTDLSEEDIASLEERGDLIEGTQLWFSGIPDYRIDNLSETDYKLHSEWVGAYKIRWTMWEPGTGDGVTVVGIQKGHTLTYCDLDAVHSVGEYMDEETFKKKGEPIGANCTTTYAYIVFAILFIVLGIRSLFKQKKK